MKKNFRGLITGLFCSTLLAQVMTVPLGAFASPLHQAASCLQTKPDEKSGAKSGEKPSGMTEADPVLLAEYEAKMKPTQEKAVKAGLLLEQGKFKEAEPLLEEVIKEWEDANSFPSLNYRSQLVEVYIGTDQNQKALEMLQFIYKYRQFPDKRADLNMALVCARFNDYQTASFYFKRSDALSEIAREDLPGTLTLLRLKATILLARGMDSQMHSRHQEALADLNAAAKLAPRNGLIPYRIGMSLTYLDRSAEAAPYFRKAAEYGRGKIAEDAKERVALYR